MTMKEIIKGEEVLVCDVCSNKIDLSSRDKLSFSIRGRWWKAFEFTHLDICGKHSNKILSFIKQLKKEVNEK